VLIAASAFLLDCGFLQEMTILVEEHRKMLASDALWIRSDGPAMLTTENSAKAAPLIAKFQLALKNVSVESNRPLAQREVSSAFLALCSDNALLAWL
jgi:hypothetical protein